MGGILEQAATILVPKLGAIAAIAVGTGSARTDLAAAAQLGPEVEKGRFVTLIADADCFYAFNSSDAGTIDETATSGATRCFRLPGEVPTPVWIDAGFTWLLHKAPGGATIIRAYLSSAPGARLGT